MYDENKTEKKNHRSHENGIYLGVGGGGGEMKQNTQQKLVGIFQCLDK